ncbi:UNC93-like protein [Ischnura elegans]|uniref:UNC93-like protein n=1 Tax=Ischnura elegans TaxID=197161 RepID=UPI001ED8696B|nr:UNC93-like protein [Ischnura elegans]
MVLYAGGLGEDDFAFLGVAVMRTLQVTAPVVAPGTKRDVPAIGFEPRQSRSPPPTPSPDHGSRVWRALRNVAVLSFAFLLHASAHGGTVGMQSSVNAAESAGTAALAVASATAWAAGCAVAGVGPLRNLASGKWALAVSLLAAAPYTATTTMLPDVVSLLPAAAMQGVATAVLWASHGAYLAAWESELGRSSAGKLSYIMFFVAVHSGDVCGNLLMSTVLSLDHPPLPSNFSKAVPCGFDFCLPPADNSDGNLVRPPQRRLSQVGYAFLACVAAASLLVALFLDPVKRVRCEERRRITDSAEDGPCLEKPTHVAVLSQMGSPYQMLLVPITLFAGMEEAFLHTDFTQAYVACSVGISHLGYVMACYAVASGVGAVISCFASGYLAEGRATLLVIGAALHGGLVIVMIVWSPQSEHPYSLFFIASLWGLCDALWKTQINVIYEAFFPDDPTTAMVVLWLWESAGYALGCGLSVPLCTGVKLHSLLVTLVLGLIGYSVVECCLGQHCKGRKVYK